MADGWKEALQKTTHRRIILDMDTASPVHGQQEASGYNGHFGCTCYHPLFCFNQFGDCRVPCFGPATYCGSLEGDAGTNRGSLREEDSPQILSLPSQRFMNTWRRRAFCMPSGFPPTRCFKKREHLPDPTCGAPTPENPSFGLPISNIKRPVGTLGRVIAKVEWHRGELFPRVGFIVTNRSARAQGVVHFYSRQG